MEDFVWILSVVVCGVIIPLIVTAAALIFVILKPAKENKTDTKKYSLDQQKEIDE